MKKLLLVIPLTAVLALGNTVPARADASTDAALALGAFAVLNQLVYGQTILSGIFGPRQTVVVQPPPLVYAPPPVAYAPPPPVVYAPPPVVYTPPPPVVYAPAPVIVQPLPRVVYAPAPVIVRPAPRAVYAPPPVFVRRPPAYVVKPWRAAGHGHYYGGRPGHARH